LPPFKPSLPCHRTAAFTHPKTLQLTLNSGPFSGVSVKSPLVAINARLNCLTGWKRVRRLSIDRVARLLIKSQRSSWRLAWGLKGESEGRTLEGKEGNEGAWREAAWQKCVRYLNQTCIL
jgi:hypothetical protein